MAAIDIPGRFQVLEEIVSDDLEVLLRARDTVLDREVLLKTQGPVLASFLHADDDRERALREARALARVRSPGVMRLLDVIDTGAAPLLVLEVVAGETLRDRLERDGPMDPEAVRDLGHVLADALDAVHRAGVLHRGLSTRVIVIRHDGTPCLTDFTFAKFDLTSLQSSIDYDQAMPMVPLNPASEQLEGMSGDARSDVYGLGCVLYQCLTGREPAEEPTPIEGAPAELARIVTKAISKSPLKRFQSAAELRDALKPPAPPVAAPPAPAPAAGPAPRLPRRALAVAAAALVLAAGGTTAALLLRGGDPAEPAKRGIHRDPTVVRTRGGPDLGSDYSSSRALLIGIGNAYREKGFVPLPNAEPDVDAVAAQLAAMPWEQWKVTKLLGAEANRKAVLDAMVALEKDLDDNGRILLYFAGHGMAHERAGNSGWIIPADGVPLAKDPGRSTWISFDEFSALFERARAKHILVALDCCYSGRLAVGRSAQAAAYADRFLRERAHVVLTSGRPFETVSDGIPGENSPFAAAFVSALRAADREAITSSSLYSAITEDFTARGVGHIPQMVSAADSMGQFVFFLRERGGK